MTNEELNGLRALSITDRCWAFNAMPEVRGWTISRRADYLHMHLDVRKPHTADCQTYGYYYCLGDRDLYRERHSVDRYGRPDELVSLVGKHTRIDF